MKPFPAHSGRPCAVAVRARSPGAGALGTVLCCGVALWSGADAQEVLPNDPDQTLTPSVSVEHLWDSNLFRLPDGESPDVVPGDNQRSDQATITGVGLKYDKVYSLQRFTLNVGLERYDYQSYDYLDFTARNGSANWAWTASPDVTGHLLFTRSQTLNSFTDFVAADQRNIDTNENRRFDVDWRVGAAIHVGAALYQIVQFNTIPVFELEDVRLNSLETNATYFTEANNSVGLYTRYAQGTYLNQNLDYPEQVDDAFDEREVGLRVNYAVDGQTGLFAQIGVLSRDNEHFGDRNFHGIIGNVAGTWYFSGKTSAVLAASRTLSSYVANTSSYVYADKVSLGPVWAVTDKTTLSARLAETDYRFEGALTPQPFLRDDHIHSIALTAQWQPLRSLGLTATWTHSNRNSTQAGLQFVDQMLTIEALLAF